MSLETNMVFTGVCAIVFLSVYFYFWEKRQNRKANLVVSPFAQGSESIILNELHDATIECRYHHDGLKSSIRLLENGYLYVDAHADE